MSFSVPRCNKPMCGSAFSIISPFNCKIKRRTPCAAGCWGPKFKFTALTVRALKVSLFICGVHRLNILLFINIMEYFYKDILISVLFIHLLCYLVLLYNLFSLFFLFDVRYVKTLVELKYTNYNDTLNILLILILLSLAGMPPLLGFCSKFLLFSIYFSAQNYYIVFLVFIFNLFSIYFYLQNLRFVTIKKFRHYFVVKNNYIFINSTLLLIVILLSTINITAFLFVDDI